MYGLYRVCVARHTYADYKPLDNEQVKQKTGNKK